MGRELQKKKNRSSTAKIRMKPKSKRVNPLGNPIIAANWNQSETLTQNYRRLGLTSRLNAATGGIEKLPTGKDTYSKSSTISKLAIETSFPTTITPTEAKVERDPETGKIIRVIHPGKKPNPLNDPLNSDSEDDEEKEYEEFNGFEGEEQNKEKNDIVRRLEELASREAPKKERTQSEREREWIETLVRAHGDDYGRMFRDRKLNPMQQTEADIKRRVSKWRPRVVWLLSSIGVEWIKGWKIEKWI